MAGGDECKEVGGDGGEGLIWVELVVMGKEQFDASAFVDEYDLRGLKGKVLEQALIRLFLSHDLPLEFAPMVCEELGVTEFEIEWRERVDRDED